MEFVRQLRTQTLPFLVSFFVFPKKEEGFRPVHNLEAPNRFVVHHLFKVEGNSMLKNLVTQAD
jgi:hypothetical protein